MTKEEKMEILENLDNYCSFDLMEQLGIQVHYFEFAEPIYGYYTPMLSTHQMIVNSSLSLEKQEKAFEHLVAHYLLHEGVPFCLDKDTFLELEGHKRAQYIFLLKKLSAVSPVIQ